MKRGFTVVEILVTLVIIAILLGLGTLGMRATLANGRDSERKADIETIARGLEARYDRGNTLFALNTSDGLYNSYKNIISAGAYPGVLEFEYGIGWGRNEFSPAEHNQGREFMYRSWGLSKSAATSPSGYEMQVVCEIENNCQPAGSAAPVSKAFSNNATDRYVYEPVDANGNICNSNDYNYAPCVGFNLYWISETMTTNAPSIGISGLQVHRSKHQ